ncbi:MAG TPA: AAA family ATPase [Candidatus Nanopelagicales bacterium]|nr:AAA family ATPase [Candidatus Nanopelagicales bacterium]
MLTRLKVTGFKNLVDVDVRFGPFTCVAGANGVGKSNLFDAITFLGDLADKTLMDAALSVRSEGGRAPDVRGIFTRQGERYADEIHFSAEMVIPPEGIDDLGQEARATTTFLRYELGLKHRTSRSPEDAGALEIFKEELTYIKKQDAARALAFTHKKTFRDSLSLKSRRAPFISTSLPDEGPVQIRVHNDSGGEEKYPGGGKPRSFLASRLPRTVLSTANAAESPTALLARREMQSWRLLQLEPSAMRAPDGYQSPARVDSHGAHLPATLARLTGVNRGRTGGTADEEAAAGVQARIANRLSELVQGVRDVYVDADDRRELLTLVVTDASKTPYEARNLSDGTLRFLALALLEQDPEARGLLCLEEPENGIHPARITSMLDLLQDLAVDSDQPVSPDNPLRQVIINTHSPGVVAQLPDDSLLIAILEPALLGGRRFKKVAFKHLSETWRQDADPEQRTAARGDLLAYLNPLGEHHRESADCARGAGAHERGMAPLRRAGDPLRSR